MSKPRDTTGWENAIGVVPLDVVLAEEHDLVHGDNVRERQGSLSLDFTPDDLSDLPGIARSLRDARRHEARRLSNPERYSEGETALDRTVAFILGPDAGDNQPPNALRGALRAYEESRASATLIGTAGNEAAIAASSRMLRQTLAERLNVLLDSDLSAEPCFRHLIDGGAVDAIGDEQPPERHANRLLLQCAFPGMVRHYRDERLALLYEATRRTRTSALCLSGGGIRSATFALGVTQGFARHGLLAKFDYLSTVSGGGYIGSWLSAWMRNSGPESVHESLGRRPESKLSPEPGPLRHLRAFARYLSPRAGLMTADTWTLVATILRNLILNWMVLVPILAAAILLPRILTELLRILVSDAADSGGVNYGVLGSLLSVAVASGLALGALALACLHSARNALDKSSHYYNSASTTKNRLGFGTRVAVGATLVLAGLVAVLRMFSSNLSAILPAPACAPESVTQCAPSYPEIFVLALAVGAALAAFARIAMPRDTSRVLSTQKGMLLYCIAPMTVAVLLLTSSWFVWWHFVNDTGTGVQLFWGAFPWLDHAPLARRWELNPGDDVASTLHYIQRTPALSFFVVALLTLIHFVGWMIGTGGRRRPWREWSPMVLSGLVAGVIGLFVLVALVISAPSSGREELYVTLAVPAMLTMVLAGSQVFTGWTSQFSSGAEREWAARLNAWLLIVIVSWLAFSAISLYSPRLLDHSLYSRAIAALGGITGVITLVMGARGASRVAPAGRGAPSTGERIRSLSLMLAAPAFALAVLAVIARGNQLLLTQVCSVPAVTGCVPAEPDVTALRRAGPVLMLASDEMEEIYAQALAIMESTGADSRVHETLQEVAAVGSSVVSTHSAGAPISDSLASEFAQRVDELEQRVSAALGVDSSLAAGSAELTRIALHADTLLLLGSASGDSLLYQTLGDRKFLAERIDARIGSRFENRDTLIVAAFTMARSVIEDLFGRLRPPVTPADTAVLQGARRVFFAMKHRMESSVGIEQAIRADSVTRAQSLAETETRLLTVRERLPGPRAAFITAILLLAILLALGMRMSARIDTNQFSLHGMYHSRIVRAFLGASRPPGDRQPHPFTGFDPDDDMPMGRLWPAGVMPEKGRSPGRIDARPPLHVVNVALNLVAGRRLAWQQRKAQSMTITPLHAGSLFLGYRRTSHVPGARSSAPLYGGPQGVALGTAVTISGAAASPNAGYHSSPLVTFLMTLFNARLGWWLGNPGPAGATTYHLSSPRQKIVPILSEMFGLTTDRSKYVYLSDGGHFENLALYEMVLRRCRFIVVSDAGCDPGYSFEDLGNAVRKIRIDLGVEIDFPDGVDIRARGAGTGHHWAIGRIRYSAVDGLPGSDDGTSDGILVYIKPSVYGNEPRDVLNYAEGSPDFPHESTTDQFFTESQFESYRALGEHIAREIVTTSLGADFAAHGKDRSPTLFDLWKGAADRRDGVKPPAGVGYSSTLQATAST
jgi:hypothetical protein